MLHTFVWTKAIQRAAYKLHKVPLTEHKLHKAFKGGIYKSTDRKKSTYSFGKWLLDTNQAVPV